MLRPITESFPPIKSKLVTLIKVQPTEERDFATSVGDKRNLIRTGAAEDFVAVWTGNWKSDAFEVTEEVLLDWRLELV